MVCKFLIRLLTSICLRINAVHSKYSSIPKMQSEGGQMLFVHNLNSVCRMDPFSTSEVLETQRIVFRELIHVPHMDKTCHQNSNFGFDFNWALND